MRGTVSYRIDVEDEDHLRRMRQAGHEFLADQDGVTVSSSSSALIDEPFTVIGSVRGKPDDRWSEIVRASSAEHAEQLATAADDSRTVTGVIPGEVDVQQ